MDFQLQYNYVCSSRRALLDYCATVAPEDLIVGVDAFAGSSIRDLLIHIANTYHWWIGKHALGLPWAPLNVAAFTHVTQIGNAMDNVNDFMAVFCSKYTDHSTFPVEASLGEKRFESTPVELFTHAITHEFHHKGQILSLTRQLGYKPIDTDIIR